jgi:outer membrane cobalamin receptor
MIRITTYVSVLLCLTTALFCQTPKGSTISGFVYDASNGEALIGANVYIKELTIGGTTNLSGYFALPNVPAGKHILTVSYMGYKSNSQPINVKSSGNEIIKINLSADAVVTKEVVITSDSVRTIDKLFAKPISKVELNAQQINSIPRVIEADLLRSLQTLPGVQPLSDFSSALFIRGGTPDQNLYLIDGTDVYNPEHAFGLFSTFNTNAIKKVELSKGGFGAEYGGRLSSVLNVTNLDGNRNRFQGDAAISLLSASTTLQAPLGSFGSISGSFRRTYLDQTIAKFVDDIPTYYFYDGNLKAFLDLGEKDKVVVSFYGGQDVLDYKFDKEKDDSPTFKYDWGNYTGSVNWKKIITPSLFANFWITGSKFNSNFDFDEMNFTEKNEISDITFKGNLEYYFSKQFDLKFGFEQKNLKIYYKEDFSNGLVLSDNTKKQYTGYFTTNWRPAEAWDIEAGLRYDYYKSDKNYSSYDPRFSVKYRLDETTNLKFSTGVFHQYLHRIPRYFITSLWFASDKALGGSSANHFILGFEKEIASVYELEVEGYYKKYDNIYEFNQNLMATIEPSYYTGDNKPVYTKTDNIFNKGKGNSYGVEALLRKDYGSITGWLGYSYSKTEYTFENVNYGRSFTPRHDRTHTINMVANIDYGKLQDELFNTNIFEDGNSKWLIGINFVYSTGQPITMPGSAYVVNKMPDWYVNKENMLLYPTDINSIKLPAYARLDFSLTYEKNYGSWTLAPYLQIFNLGNRKNVWFIQYKTELKDKGIYQEVKTINMLPLLPSIGVNIKF